jgi:hypothetical protein
MLYIIAKHITMKTKLFLTILLAGIINVATYAARYTPSTQQQENTYWKAIQYYQEEDFYSSLLLFKNLLDEDPENVELNYYTGMCYYNLDKPKLAKWHFSYAASDNCCRIKILLLARDNGNDNNLLSYNQ